MSYIFTLSNDLSQRAAGICELCGQHPASKAFSVTGKSDDKLDQLVALCGQCVDHIDDSEASAHRTSLEGSIWNPEKSVQALSYRLLQRYKDESWAKDLLDSVSYDEETIEWAMSGIETVIKHIDAFGNLLENGDNVVLTQALDVKGMNFTASKGTVVKRIKLIHDNAEQIEGRVNEQSIIILTKYVKKQ